MDDSQRPPSTASGRKLEDVFDELCFLSQEERLQRLEELQPSPAEARQLEKLLAHYDAAQAGEEVIQAPETDASRLMGMPSKIGPYRVQRVLGSGGMGVVYLAEQENPNRLVAIKVLRDTAFGIDAERRFAREAELLGRLQHAGIAQIFESGRTEGPDGTSSTYIAMEFIDGKPIHEHAQAKGLGLRERVLLLRELAQAVHHAHLRGVLHRDLKPSNVIVDGEGQVKVIDFGVARSLAAGQEATLRTMTGQVIGTLAYMSPEQARGATHLVDARTDVYALGVMAYELLAGKLPHDLRGQELPEAVRRINDVDPTRLGTLVSGCRGDLEHIVDKALAKEPERRYQSAAALADDLERALRFQPIEARPVSTLYQLRRFARRHRAASFGIGATFLALAVGGAVSLHYAIRNADLAAAEVLARTRADNKAAEAERLAETARSRSAELEQVADFQSEMLSSLSASQLGQALRDDLHEDILERIELETLDPSQREAEKAAAVAALQRLDATTIAKQIIDQALLAPSVGLVEERFSDQPIVRARLLKGLGSAWASLRMFPEALTALDPSLELYRRERGTSDPQTLEVHSMHAQVLQALDPDEATASLEQGIDELEGAENEAERLHFQVLLASQAVAEGDPERAIEMFEELVRSRPQGSASMRDYLVAKKALAHLYSFVGRPAEGEAIQREILPEVRERFGIEDPLAVGILDDLGVALASLEKWADAEATLREALVTTRVLHGDEDDRTLRLLENLAMCQIPQGRFEQAAAGMREVVNVRWKVGASPELLRGRIVLAEALDGLQAFEDAEGVFFEALEQTFEMPELDVAQRQKLVQSFASHYTLRDEVEPGAGWDERAKEILQLFED